MRRLQNAMPEHSDSRREMYWLMGAVAFVRIIRDIHQAQSVLTLLVAGGLVGKPIRTIADSTAFYQPRTKQLALNFKTMMTGVRITDSDITLLEHVNIEQLKNPGGGLSTGLSTALFGTVLILLTVCLIPMRGVAIEHAV